MKRLLITGSGGSPAANFIRSLRSANESFFLVGTDSHEYNLLRSETDKFFLVPKADEKDYVDFLNDITKENQLELIHVQNDHEMPIISENRKKLNINTFLPDHDTILTCQNKFDSYLLWKKEGLPQPETVMINTKEDLQNAFQEISSKLWLRYIGRGAGATGAIPTSNYDLAKSWLDYHNGWGKFSAAQILTPNSVTWQSIWKDGELIIAQGRKRLSWELGGHMVSGISGATGTAITFSDKQVDEIAQKAIITIDKNPNGIFSVDLTYDKNNVPNPTEINIGRFFTTHHFFTKAGLNMPYIFVKLAYNEKIPEISKKLNPLPSDLIWVRGIDFNPIFSNQGNITKIRDEFNERRKKFPKK